MSHEFVHLHVRSNYSPEALSSVEDIVQTAKTLGMKAVALTDFNTIAGAITFFIKASELKIKPILGCEISILPFKAKSLLGKTFSLTLLVENEKGFQNLVNLINISQKMKGETGAKPYILHSDLNNHADGLIVLCGGDRGELTDLLRNKRADMIEEYLNMLLGIFPKDNLILELLSPYYKDCERINKYFAELGRILEIKTVATNDARYIAKEDCIAAKFLTNEYIDSDTLACTIADKNEPTLHFASAVEMNEGFKAFQPSLENTGLIADKCNFFINLEKKQFPKQDFVRGVDADSFLWNHFVEKVEDFYRTSSNNVINERLNAELEYIKQKNLSNYFVLLLKIADDLKKQGILTGIGRGNLLTSLAAYLAGITTIDPIERHPMVFQEFSNDDKYPRLTLEIPEEKIASVINFTKSLYAEKYMCFVGNYHSPTRRNILSSILDKLRISEVARTSYFTDEILSTKLSKDETLASFLGDDYQKAEIKNPKTVSFILAKLLNANKTLKYTPDNIALTLENLSFLVPLEPLKEHEPYSISQFDYSSMVNYGMPVLSFAGEKLLDTINLTLKYVSEEESENININQISFSDKYTFETFIKGYTTGIPHFESITFKTILKRQQPSNIEQLRKILVETRKTSSAKANRYGESEFIRSVVDIDIAYKCAYLKTHYPSAYLTALINTFSKAKDISIYIREAKKIGISIKPPDILASDFDFKQNPNEIRMGLSIIPGLDRISFGELDRLRKGFPYSDLADFISNTNLNHLPINTIKKIIQCGAFDSFLNSTRYDMLSELGKISLQMKQENENTLVTAIQLSADEHNQNEHKHKDDPDVLLNWEISATRFPVTVDQIEINRKFLQRIFAVSPTIKNLNKLKEPVNTFIGYINWVDKDGPFIGEKTAYLLDFEGIPVRVPPDVAAKQNIYAVNLNLPVVLLGEVMEHNDEPEIKAISISTLSTIIYSAENFSQIILDLSNENDYTLKQIYKAIYPFKGNSKIDLINFPNEKKRIFKKIKEFQALICPMLKYKLEHILTREKVIIK